jgi:site-specific DNA-methyltransferase (adenine-specific)
MDCGRTTDRKDYVTPKWLFEKVNCQYGQFDLDAAASVTNAMVDAYYTAEDNALEQPWEGKVWVNPPYGRGLEQWVEKALMESAEGRARLVAMLLPVRTDTKWFAELMGDRRVHIYFITGRLTFEGQPAPAPFASMLVLIAPGKRGEIFLGRAKVGLFGDVV